MAEDFAVDGIEVGHWDKIHIIDNLVGIYPNTGGYGAKN
jgi:hypothetical protein